MHLVRSILTISSLIVFSASFAQGWSKFTGTLDSFEIFAPGELEVRETTYDSEYGAVFPAREYLYEEDGSRYVVTVVDYTDARRIHAEREDRSEADYELYWEVDVRASIAYAAWNLRQRGGEITFDAYHYIDRVEGHQLQITNDDQSRTYAAIYLHDSRLYIVEATVPPNSIPPGFFQQSLQWINEDGSRVRYQNYSDAIKVRDAPVRD